jgi:hypothetical protein
LQKWRPSKPENSAGSATGKCLAGRRVKARKVRSHRFTLPLVLVVYSVASACAQQADGFRFATPLSLSTGYDNNFVAGSQVLDDTVSILTAPTLSWTKVTHRANFSVEYEPEFELFSGHQDLNAWNHSATLRFTQRISDRLSGGLIRGGQSQFIGAATVEKRLSGVWVAAGYQRYLGFFCGLALTGAAPAGTIPFVSGLAAGSLFQVASVRAWGKLTRRTGVEGSVQRVLNGLNPQGQAVNSLVGHFRLDYKLSERLAVFARNPVGLLASRRAWALLARLRNDFQLIVLDSPPIVPIVDGHILSRLADGAVMVVRARHTRRELLQRAVESFAATNLLGVVLNDVEYKDTRYSYVYEYYQRHYLGRS